MQLIKNQQFGGERPLFASHDLRLERITITDGESGIKQCKNIEADNCKFYGKYASFTENIRGGTLTEASSPTAILHREAVRLSGTAMT